MRNRLALLGLAVSLSACRTLGAPGYQGSPSDHFDGERFFNPIEVDHKSLGDLVKWRATSEAPLWELRTDRPAASAPPSRVGHGELRVTWINHATVLVQADGVNVLTDPIWSEYAGPYHGVGQVRFDRPGIRFEDLPPIDVVLLSHDHYDHLDVPTLRRLWERHHPRVLAGLGTRALLEREGVGGGEDVDWWQERAVRDGVSVVPVPARHWARRGLTDLDNTLWLGFVLRTSAGSVYFAGDTGWGPHFEEIRARVGAPRVALLPVGAYLPRWFMGDVHLSPDEAVMAARVLGAEVSVPIHWGTFRLGDDGQEEPIEALRCALSQLEPAPTFAVLDLGGHVVLSRSPAVPRAHRNHCSSEVRRC